MSSPSSSSSTLLRWLQRKRYQYEVTFSLYMLTPIEKFIFTSFLFLFLSMIVIAGSLYLPQHITFLASRAWFYYAGDDIAVTNSATAAAVASTATVAAAGAASFATLTAAGAWHQHTIQQQHQQHHQQKPLTGVQTSTETVVPRAEL